jgi:hypothetical protein
MKKIIGSLILMIVLCSILWAVFVSLKVTLNVIGLSELILLSTLLGFYFLPVLRIYLFDKGAKDQGLRWLTQGQNQQIDTTLPHKDRPFHWAFHLSQNELLDIVRILQEKMATNPQEITQLQAEAEYKYKPGSKITGGSKPLMELFKIKNVDDSALEEVKITISHNNQPQQVPKVSLISILFRKKESASFCYYVQGSDEEKVKAVSTDLEEMIRYRLKHISVNLIIFSLEIFLGWVFFNLFFSYLLFFHNLQIKISWALIIFPSLLGLLAFFGILICKYFFPSYNFYWGYYQYIFDNKQKVGIFLLSNLFGLLLGLIAGFLAGLLANSTPIISIGPV